MLKRACTATFHDHIPACSHWPWRPKRTSPPQGYAQGYPTHHSLAHASYHFKIDRACIGLMQEPKKTHMGRHVCPEAHRKHRVPLAASWHAPSEAPWSADLRQPRQGWERRAPCAGRARAPPDAPPRAPPLLGALRLGARRRRAGAIFVVVVDDDDDDGDDCEITVNVISRACELQNE
jgi:hypothetical protein